MDVPIKFDYHGKEYNGVFQSVMGAGSAEMDHWHLMIDGYYQGQFFYTERNGWRFTSQTQQFEDLTWFFEFYMVSWFA